MLFVNLVLRVHIHFHDISVEPCFTLRVILLRRIAIIDVFPFKLNLQNGNYDNNHVALEVLLLGTM